MSPTNYQRFQMSPLSYNFIDESSMPNYMRTFANMFRLTEGDGFRSEREKRKSTGALAIEYLRVWLDGTEETRAQNEANYLKVNDRTREITQLFPIPIDNNPSPTYLSHTLQRVLFYFRNTSKNEYSPRRTLTATRSRGRPSP